MASTIPTLLPHCCCPPGDGRLGLLIAQVCALHAPGRVTHFGRHPDKMSLVSGTVGQVVSFEEAAEKHTGAFDLVVEASGDVLQEGVGRVYILVALCHKLNLLDDYDNL